MRNYKELEIILSSFECNKHCPYCTAKITKWPSVEDDIRMLSLNAKALKRLGYTFHYLTIGGNGEPTLHNYSKLKAIVNAFNDYDIPIKRVLTSGNLFKDIEKDKLELFNKSGYIYEVTITSANIDRDMKTLGYNNKYFDTEAFKNSRIRVNYVMLKNNRDKYINDMKYLINTYPNIETVAVKLLNVNTKNGLVDNQRSEWIVNNGVSKIERENIKKELDDNFSYNGTSYDTFSWDYKGKEIYFSWKKETYGFSDLVWYGNKFVNYSLEEQKIELIDKIYFASHFKKTIKDGSYDFHNDLRDKILSKSGTNISNYNYNSFIVNDKNETKYHYIGPFYNELASNGELTSTSCNDVVETELKLIKDCDTFIIYLEEDVSSGSITELIYAATLNKKIIIFYEKNNNTTYNFKTSNWFPIVSALKIAENVTYYPVKSDKEIMDILI